MNILRLAWQFFRISILNELQYRANVFIQIMQSGFALATGLGGLAIVFSHTQTLAGWRPAELLAVLGVYLLIGGMINMVIRPSVQRLMDDVRAGTLDYVLTKPEDAQVLVSVRQIEVWKLADIIVGLVVIGVALWQLGASVGVLQTLAFAIALGAGTAVTYSFLLILATCSFWFIKIQNIILIFGDVYEAGRWPVGIYPGWLRTVLTLVVPVAFAITVPAEALAGRLTWQSLLGALALAAAMLIGARWFWLRGIRQYSGASA